MYNNAADTWGLAPTLAGNLSFITVPLLLPSPGVLFLKSAALTLMVALTIGGNLLVILSVLCGGLVHRSPTHLLIANLAGADLLLGAAVLPLSAARELTGGAWQFGNTLCKVWTAADVLCCTASILSLCGISVDRYIGVTRPLAYSGIMTKKRAILMIAGIWVLALAISIGPPLGWHDVDNVDHVHQDTNLQCEVNKQLGYVIFSIVGSFYAPMLIVVVLYIQVYRAVMQRSSALQEGCNEAEVRRRGNMAPLRVHVAQSPATSCVCGGTTFMQPGYHKGSGRSLLSRVQQQQRALTSSKFKREKKCAQTLAIVVGGFLLCWLPFFIILPIDSACSSCGLSGWPFTLAFWLGYFNSCINPFIYACSSHELRRAFLVVLCRLQPRARSRRMNRINTSGLAIPMNNLK